MRLAGHRLGTMACPRQHHGRLRRHPSADQQASRGPQTRHGVGIDLGTGCAGRDAAAIRELGGSDRHGAARLKGGEDRGEAPACLMSISASTT